MVPTKKRAAAPAAAAASTAPKKKAAKPAAAAALVPSEGAKVETRVDKAQALRAAQALLQHHAKVCDMMRDGMIGPGVGMPWVDDVGIY